MLYLKSILSQYSRKIFNYRELITDSVLLANLKLAIIRLKIDFHLFLAQLLRYLQDFV